MWERDFVYIYAYILFRLMVSLGRERLKKKRKKKNQYASVHNLTFLDFLLLDFFNVRIITLGFKISFGRCFIK